MISNETAIKVENLSKIYRIGLKENLQDSFGSVLVNFLKSPIQNYHKYRSLYRFDKFERNIDNSNDKVSDDIIWALKGVSFEVRRGEVLGIIGRNGAGKSTLLKILAKITPPTNGFAEIHGKIASLLEVGTGFHQELTGRENVYLNGTILGMTKKEVDLKFDQIVEFSGVEKFLDTPVKRYSSGMRVRLAFAVAAHLEPEILVIDEVLSVGDADFQKKCINKMEDVSQQGRTVLFVSHNMPAVTRLCKRAILLQAGKIADDGPSHKVVSSYLTSSLGTTAAREWSDPSNAPGGEVCRLRAVHVRNKDNRVSDTLDIREDLKIEMEYEVLRSGHVLLPHFSVTNERGQIAFVTTDQDQEWRQRKRPMGKYVSTVWIPGNLLAEGMMFIGCYLITLNPDTVQFAERSAVAFNVVDAIKENSARGDYAKRISGVVRPLLKWATEFTPNGSKSPAPSDLQ